MLAEDMFPAYARWCGLCNTPVESGKAAVAAFFAGGFSILDP